VVGSGDGGESGLCAPHGGAELGDEFFGGVGVVAESAGEVAVEAAGVAGPVDGFVGAGGVVVGGGVELGEGREVDRVGGGPVVGAVAALDDGRCDGGEVLLGGVDAGGGVAFGSLLVAAGDDLVGSVALLGGEHGIGAGDEARPTGGRVVAVVGLAVCVGGVGGLPEHDLGGAFAASDLGAVALPGSVGAEGA